MSAKAKPQVPDDKLRRTLEPVLSQYFEAPRQIRKLRRRVSSYSSSCALENLEVELDHEQPLRLVFKDLSPRSLLPAAQQVRPAFLYHPRREIETYRRLLDPARLGTPLCYGSVVSSRVERYWLFLERVPGPLLWQVGSMKSWKQAAQWLALLHTEFDTAPSKRNSRQLDHLLYYDAHFYSVWLQRAEQFMRDKYNQANPAAYRRFSALADRYDRVIQRLMELPTTVIHGEFFPSNVICRQNPRRLHICPIDWEVSAIAPGLIDLGALTAGQWSADDRKQLIAAYRERWEPARRPLPSLKELVEAVGWCQLHLAMQFLGWASDWSPPELHAQNWLREALRLATRLGL
jgi:hypothetical protein